MSLDLDGLGSKSCVSIPIPLKRELFGRSCCCYRFKELLKKVVYFMSLQKAKEDKFT